MDSQNSPKRDYPPYGSGGSSEQQQDLTIDGIPNNFPQRRSRASRTFKNPPQPHMCIKEKTLDGKEVFINVLSWTRIANPNNPDAPIPLYGGMKIPPGSPRSPSRTLVYAVMASPEVLKKAGRKCPDTPERMNLVDLMCEFVEAMNPSLHLSRKPEIMKDRDLSGELKDVWSAVQACRDKGRVESTPPENLVVYTEFGPDSAPSYGSVQQNIIKATSQPKPPQSPPPNESIQLQDDKQSAITENSEKSLMDELQKETENMKLNNQTTTLPSNEQLPQSPTTPQQQKEHKNFFPMFRSSKSKNNSFASDVSSLGNASSFATSSSVSVTNTNTNGSSINNQNNSPNNNGSQTSSEDKKKGLNFFRRNKSASSQSPTTVQQTSNQAADNNCQMQIHLDGGVTSGEIIESSSATIAAK